MTLGDGTRRLPVKLQKRIGKQEGNTIHIRLQERLWGGGSRTVFESLSGASRLGKLSYRCAGLRTREKEFRLVSRLEEAHQYLSTERLDPPRFSR
jgi:hypothetical protein